MLKAIDNFLNGITMYRIVLYALIALIAAAAILGTFGILPYSPVAILLEAFFITAVCLGANMAFAWAFNVPANAESAYITALILALIITPPQSAGDGVFFSLAAWASVLAMASKYIIAIRKKHVFNPAALAVVITAFALGQSASWWIGTAWMLPFAAIGGFLIARKLRRFDLVLSFLAGAAASVLATAALKGGDLLGSLSELIISSPAVFFATIMLTEPLTTPPTRRLRIAYGALVGLLFSPSIHIGAVYSTPELALAAGNIFSYAVSPKERLILKLKKVREVAHDTYDFIFRPDERMRFAPGQYLEWTVPDTGADSRGNRRYFTIASSPTEQDIIMGVKFYENPSSFKRHLAAMQEGDTIVASQRSGDFTLPADAKEKLVFVAGGIGITPFRSMLKYLADTGERRDIVMLYSNRSAEDIAYADILEEARERIGVRTLYVLTDTENIPPAWQGLQGRITPEAIRREIPDFGERTFYVSGPQAMVTGFDEMLREMGVARARIRKDYFPGFA
jgi:ferredoxin-NADP reductase